MGQRHASAPNWTPEERQVLDRLDNVDRVQTFLDTLAYSPDPIYRCPRRVLRDRTAHCCDGAVFAAAAFRHHGQRAWLLDLRAERDDDHILAVFRRGRHFGAVAKSNFVGLRYREPIYRSLRELALSYFENYYNLDYERSLRAYSVLLDLQVFDDRAWATSDATMDLIAARLDTIRHIPLLDAAMLAGLRRVDERSYQAGMVGTDMRGVHRNPPSGTCAEPSGAISPGSIREQPK